MPPAHAYAENATPPHGLHNFTFLLVSSGDFPVFSHTHHIVIRSEGFSHLQWQTLTFPPLQLTLREAVLVLVRNIDAPTCVVK